MGDENRFWSGVNIAAVGPTTAAAIKSSDIASVGCPLVIGITQTPFN